MDQRTSGEQHLTRATALVRAYTRGRGWIGDWMAPPLREVMLSAAGRSMNNPRSDRELVELLPLRSPPTGLRLSACMTGPTQLCRRSRLDWV
jgi:hypothetical protein